MTEEETKVVVRVIRRLGFVGGAHYCPDCMNTFHGDKGQHAPDCGYHEISEEEWLDDWEHSFPRQDVTA